MTRTSLRIALFGTLVAVLALAPSALAGKGRPGGGGGNTTTTSPLFAVKMVYDQNGNVAPNWNDQITFGIAPGASLKPWVRLDCYQSGAWVSTATHGFFAAYPWPPNFTLASGGWQGGAGECTATLYEVTSNGRNRDLGKLSFHVDA
jgi:hypothetical protein